LRQRNLQSHFRETEKSEPSFFFIEKLLKRLKHDGFTLIDRRRHTMVQATVMMCAMGGFIDIYRNVFVFRIIFEFSFYFYVFRILTDLKGRF